MRSRPCLRIRHVASNIGRSGVDLNRCPEVLDTFSSSGEGRPIPSPVLKKEEGPRLPCEPLFELQLLTSAVTHLCPPSHGGLMGNPTSETWLTPGIPGLASTFPTGFCLRICGYSIAATPQGTSTFVQGLFSPVEFRALNADTGWVCPSRHLMRSTGLGSGVCALTCRNSDAHLGASPLRRRLRMN